MPDGGLSPESIAWPLASEVGRVPLPPIGLRERVGVLRPDTPAEVAYVEHGMAVRRAIEDCLPSDWTWRGKKVLDFGCGAGRTLRSFADEAATAEFWGCDIDAPSVEWCAENLGSLPMTFVTNSEMPGLNVPGQYFDLVFGISVFTHISTHWAGWLAEMRRITSPNGLLVFTFLGDAMCQGIAGEPWNENNVGMNVYDAGQDWSLGGPKVLHSPWWIREHWGRIFSIERLEERGFGGPACAVGELSHGVVVMRQDGRFCDVAELERINPGEPRETTALYHEVQYLRAEVADLRSQLRQRE